MAEAVLETPSTGNFHGRGGSTTMRGKRLALISDDQRLAQAVQGYLSESLGHSAFLCRTESVQEHLDPLTEGPLLLAVASPAQLVPLVQSLALQRFPRPIAL